MKGWTQAVLMAALVGCGSSAEEGTATLDATAAARAEWVRSEIATHNAWLDDEVRREK
jgi:hypothetical protein